MKIEYFPETDSLYIEFAGRAGVDSTEIGEGIVLDLDADGRPVGLDIDQASKTMDLQELVLSKAPFAVERLTA